MNYHLLLVLISIASTNARYFKGNCPAPNHYVNNVNVSAVINKNEKIIYHVDCKFIK